MFLDFINTYFVEPVINVSKYNWVNTLTYAIIFVLSVFFVYKLLKYLKIKIDSNFALALMPYIFLGSVLRVLRDSNFFTSPIFVSPLIYITVFLITLPLLLLSLFLEKTTNIKYYTYFFSFGFIISGIFFTQINFVNLFAAVQILGIDLIFFILIFSFGNLTKITKPLFNKFVIFFQLYDASSTFVGVQIYGHREQHVVPNLLFNLTGTIWCFFIVKLAVALILIYIIDNYIEDEEFRNWVKIVIIILGFALGTRDMFQVMVYN